MSRTLHVRLSAREDALDRFEAAWHLATTRAPVRLDVLSFADLALLLRHLTPARWQLLARLRAEGPLSVRALAKRLGRDYKNVHSDVARLAGLALIARGEDGRVSVPWDAVRAELRLA